MLLLVAISLIMTGVDTLLAHDANGNMVAREWIPVVYMLNPFAILFEGYREALFYGQFLEARHWLVLMVEAALLFAVAQRIYRYYDRRVIKFL